MMKISEFKPTEFIKIVDVSLIKQGDMLWENGDIVEIEDVEVYENRIAVWDKEKFLSEYIYDHELKGIEKLR
ncbi:hypothetical protein [Paenibacillus vulneris]|uniref:Uncharacterized protein n=1 Tax=Paenibacillus vulneris TaxID=1133364 RepID=A0ABW3UIY2_9BACL